VYVKSWHHRFVPPRSGRLDFPAPAPYYKGGSGSDLVLLHGWSDDWRTWQSVIPELEKHHKVFAPTLLGHFGGPPWPIRDPLHFYQIVDDLERQLNEAGITTAHFAGNSFGGWLALELAVRRRAESVVAINPAGGWEPHDRNERRGLRYFKQGRFMARLVAPQAESLAQHDWLRRYAFKDVVAYPGRITPEAFVASIRGAARCDFTPPAINLIRTEGFGDLGPIDCPVRIAWGTEDRLIRWPGCYVRFPDLVPRAEWVPLEGLGHLAQRDAPGTVARTILEVTGRSKAISGITGKAAPAASASLQA
jgi:pimeloyl-ACP methyl ester carboxylesterase